MRGPAVITALVLLLGLVGAGQAAAADTPLCRPRTAPPSVRLTQVTATPVDARTTMYAFRSAAVGAAMPDGLVHVRITLPVGYEQGTAHYPVLIHLHGTNNSPTTWPAAEVEQVVGDTPVILVQPDGGASGLYTDWYGTPVADSTPAPPPAWETFHIRELLPWVDATFRTTGHRAIAGSSMGGIGSMSYPARNPGVFDAAASLSGAVNTQNLVAIVPALAAPCAWGPDPANWTAHDPTALTAGLRGVSLYVEAGDGLAGAHDDVVTAVRDAAVELLVRGMTNDFVAALGRAGVPATTSFHHGTHPSPTGPNRSYDYDALRAFLPQAMTAMGGAAA